MSSQVDQIVAEIEARVAERFRTNPTLTGGAARWSVLCEATKLERHAYLSVLVLHYDLRDAEEAESAPADDAEPVRAPEPEHMHEPADEAPPSSDEPPEVPAQ